MRRDDMAINTVVYVHRKESLQLVGRWYRNEFDV